MSRCRGPGTGTVVARDAAKVGGLGREQSERGGLALAMLDALGPAWGAGGWRWR